MARRYYDTQQKIYNLFNTHPVMSILLTDFGIDKDKIKDVCDYLLINDDEIQSTPLNAFYNDSDIIDEIAELYGYTTKPWDQHVSTTGTKLPELLNFTIYLYKFGTEENFYEKNILSFISEYDRDQILEKPKMKLTIESLGRKLDLIENKISKIPELYDIDKCPDDLLDYLGQNIGYEKEDYTLSDVSFRELLKNIIEIYKIKGTNYSFSFFFKFLGFEINLKEFYFNSTVKNPESFPGMDISNVEYFLTTENPIFDTSESLFGKHIKPTSADCRMFLYNISFKAIYHPPPPPFLGVLYNLE